MNKKDFKESVLKVLSNKDMAFLTIAYIMRWSIDVGSREEIERNSEILWEAIKELKEEGKIKFINSRRSENKLTRNTMITKAENINSDDFVYCD